MCGFIALLHPERAIASGLLTKMRDQLVHRGPDDCGLWQKNYRTAGSVNLGFRRLSILDVSAASHQPMLDEETDLAMVFNGEIYNYVELRAELESKGYRFRTTGDTEVLLRAYQHWGDDVVYRLNGMFAFVIWDGQRKLALVARDRFGEKPIYMARLPNGGIAFASEAKALTVHPDIGADIDLQVLGDVVKGRLIYGQQITPFQGITQMSAAHFMRVTLEGKIDTYQRYWTPSYNHALDDQPDRDLEEQFREHLFRSVAMRTRSDVPITASLSGGLDSSSIVAVLADLTHAGRADIKETISARFPDDPTISEGAYIDQVLQYLKLTGQGVTPDADGLARDLRKMHWHQETVIGGMSMYLEWCVMERARAAGYTVMLDGQGADEILCGYQVYFWAHQVDVFRKKGGGALKRLSRWRNRQLVQESARYKDAARRFSTADGISEDDVDYMSSALTNRYLEYDCDGLLPKEDHDLLQRERAFDLIYSSLPSNVFSGDRNSMAHSLETRYPFLDYDLVDFCTQLPTRSLMGGGWQKRIMREAMAGYLPDSVLWRVDKVGFAAPSDIWLKSTAIAQWIEDRIFSGLLKDIPEIDLGYVESLWHAHQAGETDHSSSLWIYASAGELLDMQRNRLWHEGASTSF